MTPEQFSKYLDKIFAAAPDNKVLGPLECVEEDGWVYCYDKEGKLQLHCLKETFDDLVEKFGTKITPPEEGGAFR